METTLKLKLRNERWHVYGTYKGVHVRESSGTKDRDRAMARLKEIELEIINGEYKKGSALAPQNMMFEEVALRYLRSKNTGNSDTTDSAVRKFARYFKGVPVLEIGMYHAEQYVAEMHEDNANSTIARELGQLQAIVNYGRALLRHSPVRIKKPAPDATEFRKITQEEEAALWEHMTDAERWVFGFMARTGARPMQAGRLQVRQVRIDEGRPVRAGLHVRKGQGKPTTYHKVPLSVRCGTLVKLGLRRKGLLGIEKQPYVFYQEDGDQWDRYALNHRMNRLCKAAGVDPATPYDWRHMFASRLADQYVHPMTIMRLMGHSSIEMTMRYVHIDEEDMVRAVDKLG